MNEIQINKQNTRIYYLDILRVIATFSVIILHVSGYKLEWLSPTTFDWQVMNFYDSISRFAVPVFVMISGALFLNRECNIKRIFKKNILRIVTAFCFWSVLYGILAIVLYNKSLKLAVGEMIVGHYHLWFLFMIVGLYIACPLLKKITESEILTKYFLVTSFVFSFVIPQGVNIVGVFSQSIADSMNVIIDNIGFKIAMGYSGYFVLGYALNNKEFSPKEKKIIYFIGVAGFLSAVAFNSVISIYKGETVVLFNDYLSVPVLLESIGLFVFMKNMKLDLSEKAENYLSNLSKFSFGVYLGHLIVFEAINKLTSINMYVLNPIMAIPLYAIIITVVSFIASAILNNIPILKKYIV